MALKSQLMLDRDRLRGKAGTRQVIEHLGYVQIDTISVVTRAHHHVLWSRIPDYRRSWLSELEEKDRAIFEYWAHAASYLPMTDFRYSLMRKEEFLKGSAFWFKKDKKTAEYVYDRIKQEGPLMSRDFKNQEQLKSSSTGMDWARNPLNLALRQLFMEGRIMVSHRRGFQKAYDLPENILPASVDTTVPTRKEYLRYLINRDLRAHGLLQPKEIGYLLKNTGRDINVLLKEMVRSGELEKVKVEGLGSQIYYVQSGTLKSGLAGQTSPQLNILSPFDNLVIQRNRIEQLFKFNYTLECYVPAKKRKIGYFSLPILWDLHLVGQLDAKADRKKKVFYIKNLLWEDHVKLSDELLVALHQELSIYASFNNCEEIRIWPDLLQKLDPVIIPFLMNSK